MTHPLHPTEWGGRRAQKVRQLWASRLPLPCLRCGAPVHLHETWHVGHRLPRSSHPELTWEESNQWPEHASCNMAAGDAIARPVPTNRRRPW